MQKYTSLDAPNVIEFKQNFKIQSLNGSRSKLVKDLNLKDGDTIHTIVYGDMLSSGHIHIHIMNGPRTVKWRLQNFLYAIKQMDTIQLI